jgi:hypothetical protein
MNKYEALDIETIWDDGVAKPICIAITRNEDVLFKRTDVSRIDGNEIIDFLLEKCSSKKIYYVHNLTFEMFVFLKYLMNRKVEFKMVSANKSIYSAEIKYKNKTIKMRCSLKLTMLSLKKLAELCNVDEKGVFPYKILDKNLKEETNVEEEMFKDVEEFNKFKEKYGKIIKTYHILEEYCKNDAKITKESIIKYWKIIEENGLKNNNRILTAAKLSIENYFLDNKIIKKKIRLKYDRIVRKAYFGGRTEVFGNQKSNEILLHYDWSGMYAQCMKEKVFGGEVYESDVILDVRIPGFYWIKFKQKLDIPILPIKRDKLLFANGEFEGWYWFEEIVLAMENGVEIKEVKKVISCQYYGNFLERFIEKNDKIRDIGPIHRIIGKNNNNTFYGRLGMNPERLEEEIISNVEENKYEKIIENNGIYIGFKKKEKNVSNVLISAAITSKARIKLYKGMKEVINNDGRILYTDTDSIIAAFDKSRYLEKLDIRMGEILFDSKDKNTIISEGVFAMPKTYALKYIDGREVVKIKGFNVRPSFKEFKEKFYEKGDIITENIEWNKKDLMIKSIMREKKTNLYSLNKRRWSDDLKETFPLEF